MAPYYKDGKKLRRGVCSYCYNPEQYRSARRNTKAWAKRLAKLSEDRKNPSLRSKMIVRDSRGTDRKRGLDNDLDTEFVDWLVADGCSYCGDTSIKMTVDRLDNTKGHLKTNVVAACIRCNYVRRDMPLAAWKRVAEAMRVARTLNLFGDWVGGSTSRKTRGIVVVPPKLDAH